MSEIVLYPPDEPVQSETGGCVCGHHRGSHYSCEGCGNTRRCFISDCTCTEYLADDGTDGVDDYGMPGLPKSGVNA